MDSKKKNSYHKLIRLILILVIGISFGGLMTVELDIYAAIFLLFQMSFSALLLLNDLIQKR